MSIEAREDVGYDGMVQIKVSGELLMELKIPEPVWQACTVLSSRGWQSFIVGGSIRDRILDLRPQDWDLATDAVPGKVARIFQRAGYRVVPTGIKYGTVTVYIGNFPLEVTTFRKEDDYQDYRRPAKVTYVEEVVQDLARRDFTINAIAYDPLQKRLCDPFGGLEDLVKEQIRAVGDPQSRIAEDPLRMLRCIRCAALFGFKIVPETYFSLIRNAPLIEKISGERVRDEINRILMAPYYMSGIELLQGCGLLFRIIPELQECWLFKQYNPAHSYTVWRHILEALRYTPPKLWLRLAVLLHDIAKPRCFTRGSDGRGHFYGHQLAGAEMAEAVLRRLRYDNRTINRVATLIREHMLDPGMGQTGIRRLITRVGEEYLPDLIALRRADIMAHSSELMLQYIEELDRFQLNLKQVLSGDPILTIRDLAVNGHDVIRTLGCLPGPQVGKILRLLWKEVIEHPDHNRREYLIRRMTELGAPSDRPHR